MNYEEKIINGMLCSRTNPNAEFEPLPPATLTKRYMDALKRLEDTQAELLELREDNYHAGIERSLMD